MDIIFRNMTNRTFNSSRDPEVTVYPVSELVFAVSPTVHTTVVGSSVPEYSQVTVYSASLDMVTGSKTVISGVVYLLG